MIDSSISHSNPADVISSGVLQWRGHRFALEQVAPVLVDTNDSPIRSLLFLRLPCSRPRFFPCPSFPDDNWSSLKIVAKSFPRNCLLFSVFFLSNLKSRISTLGSLNFASFYKSFISTFLFFFNFKFLILLPFDGGRTELECFEKFKFSFASLFSFEVRLSKLRHLD